MYGLCDSLLIGLLHNKSYRSDFIPLCMQYSRLGCSVRMQYLEVAEVIEKPFSPRWPNFLKDSKYLSEGSAATLCSRKGLLYIRSLWKALACSILTK